MVHFSFPFDFAWGFTGCSRVDRLDDMEVVPVAKMEGRKLLWGLRRGD